MLEKEQKLKEEMIKAGRRLYQTSLVVARSGNLSCRLDQDNILITATATFLGELRPQEIVLVNINTHKSEGNLPPSSELPMHSLIYKNFPCQAIIHCHPPLINGYFAVAPALKALTFETSFYLGEVPVVAQDTPTVTKPELVIAALKNNNLVVLKNHGTVAIGSNFHDALSLTEALEEAVKTLAIARLLQKDALDALDTALKERLTKKDTA